MSDWIREVVRRQRAAEARDVARTFGVQPPEEVEHDHADVAPLVRARTMAAEAGDQAAVAEINERLRRIDPELAPPRPDATEDFSARRATVGRDAAEESPTRCAQRSSGCAPAPTARRSSTPTARPPTSHDGRRDPHARLTRRLRRRNRRRTAPRQTTLEAQVNATNRSREASFRQ